LQSDLKQKFITQKHVSDLFGCTANAVLQESMKQIEALKLIGQESSLGSLLARKLKSTL
jgi:hypothetical protein